MDKRASNTALLHYDETDLKLLRAIIPEDVYILMKQDLIRGYEYRSIEEIALLIAKQLDIVRAKNQALERVGRYGDDKFVRVVVPQF